MPGPYYKDSKTWHIENGKPGDKQAVLSLYNC